MDESFTSFCIGHHETNRPFLPTTQTVSEAHNANYDMVTTPITNAHFHSRVLALLSTVMAQDDNGTGINSRTSHTLQIADLSPADTPLSPNESTSQVIGFTSSWIDLCSTDPMIADLSRQILKLELAYAAFCGIMYTVIWGPRCLSMNVSPDGVIQYARAVLDALSYGPFMQIFVQLPMVGENDVDPSTLGDLGSFAREAHKSDTIMQPDPDLFGSWAAWDAIRSFCKYHSRLCIALPIPKLLPPPTIQARWYSEPVRLLLFDKQTFSKNSKGYPALSRPHQALLTRFMRLKTPPWLLLCDVGPLPQLSASTAEVGTMDPVAFPTPAEIFDKSKTNHIYAKDATPHLTYMRFLQSKQPPRTQIERFGAGYQDYLQAPLQPLTVNLESITYEVFEKDPIKYEWYEKAIARALHDWIEQGKSASGTDGRVVVAVVGAGRGPLVTRALRAADGVDVEVDMWALEKNPNAFVLLQQHNATIWNERVNLVKSDMRTWRGPAVYTGATRKLNATAMSPSTAPGSHESYTGDPGLDYSYLLATTQPHESRSAFYKIDILVSELLGSFADNELSPECLDGVQHLLNPEHGISIPASYTAFVTPIAAPRLHADIAAQSASNPNASETPYVVMLNAIDYLSTDNVLPAISSPGPDSLTPSPIVRTAWSFQHPSPAVRPAHVLDGQNSLTPNLVSNAHNTRSTSLTFPIQHRGTCHGLAAYFETVLYGNVQLSTNPNTMEQKSDGMISWFPLYFPLKTPLYLPDHSELTVHLWRQTDDRKVWYEWLVDAYIVIPQLDIQHPDRDRKNEGAQQQLPGFRVRIGGSELHSSIKEACLM